MLNLGLGGAGDGGLCGAQCLAGEGGGCILVGYIQGWTNGGEVWRSVLSSGAGEVEDRIGKQA